MPSDESRDFAAASGVANHHDVFQIQLLEQLRQVIGVRVQDRKSTRLNSSHGYISYAVFCLKKKNNLPSTQVTPRSLAVDCDASHTLSGLGLDSAEQGRLMALALTAPYPHHSPWKACNLYP